MGHQMTELDRRVVTVTIQKANPCPKDVSGCVALLEEKGLFSLDKALAFWEEYLQVCQQALHARHAMDARPPTPPTRAISPPNLADPVPGTLHGDGALLAAARDSRDREKVAIFLAISDNFRYANAIFINVEFSYIRERTVKDLGLQCSHGIVQIRWKDPNLATDADHTARSTVLILVSEAEASKVEMNVDILFGNRCRDERDAQLQAVGASMDIQSASSPSEVQPDDSCAGSVAEAASPPIRALGSVSSQSSCAMFIMGPDVGRQAANFLLQYEAAHQSGALRQEAQVPA